MSIYTDAMREKGMADALDLRSRAANMDGTAIIAEEQKAPAFDGTKDYSTWPAGAPVQYEGQVYQLLQPHNAANYDGNPAALPALWSITHTKDPAKAKPYVAPNGTSGMYRKDECCIFNGKGYVSLADNNPYGTSGMYMKDECCIFNGKGYVSLADNNPYSPGEYAANWSEIV